MYIVHRRKTVSKPDPEEPRTGLYAVIIDILLFRDPMIDVAVNLPNRSFLL